MARPVRALAFNQDRGCFTCCLTSGLRVFNIEPLVEKERYTVDEIGDVTKCALLNRSNILFMVKNKKSNILYAYDDFKKKFIAEIPFRSPILSIKLRRDRIAVCLEYGVYLVRWPAGGKISEVLHTSSNTNGLCELSSNTANNVKLLVAPGRRVGTVQLLDIDNLNSLNVIACHSGEIQCITLSSDGYCLATASNKGTLLRVWCTRRRVLLHTLRRGTDYATLYSMDFSKGGEYLCCCSDKGTLHVFQIRTNTGQSSAASSSSASSLLSSTGAFFSGERALATGAVPREQPAVCAFVSTTSIAVICMDGTFHKFVFTTEGTCHQEAYDLYLQIGEDDDYIV